MKRISSRDNALVKRLLRLASSSRARRAECATILDGPHLVAAYAASGREADAVVVAERALERAEIRVLFERVAARHRIVLTDRLFDEIAPVATPMGILAAVPTPVREALPATLQSCVLLDELQDWGNVGSILRSAAAAGVRQVMLSPGSVFVWSPKVLRAGQGAHFFLSIYEEVDLAALAKNFPGVVIATTAQAETSLYDADLRGHVAWAFGNEGAGLSAALAAQARLRVRIPMPGGGESLNVAAAAAICLFEQVRQTLHAAAPAAAQNTRRSTLMS